LLTTYIFDIYNHAEKDISWLKERMAIAEKEYQTVWTNDMQPNNRKVYKGLSRYYDVNMLDDLAECESGWDMTTRFQNNCLSYIPIDLNCLLYKYESDFARAHEMAKDHDTASIWRNRAALRAETIHNELWDEHHGFYFDKNYRTEKFSPVWSLASYYTLWSGVATTEQARRMVDHIKTTFLYTGGLVTTAKPKDEEAREVSPQWAYPNGWAPLHWLVSEGLTRYGFHNEAELIVRRWLNTNLEYFEEFDVFREAYNVVDGFDSPHAGVYPPQVGFGWTNAVFVDLAKKYLSSSELQKV
jgi:alpha,alpha-trehalase